MRYLPSTHFKPTVHNNPPIATVLLRTVRNSRGVSIPAAEDTAVCFDYALVLLLAAQLVSSLELLLNKLHGPTASILML
jgi:hypothetical protein